MDFLQFDKNIHMRMIMRNRKICVTTVEGFNNFLSLIDVKKWYLF